MPTQKNTAKPAPKALEGTKVNGLALGDTAVVIADMGAKYKGLRGRVTLLDPRVSGVVLEHGGVKEFFLGSDLKKA